MFGKVNKFTLQSRGIMDGKKKRGQPWKKTCGGGRAWDQGQDHKDSIKARAWGNKGAQRSPL